MIFKDYTINLRIGHRKGNIYITNFMSKICRLLYFYLEVNSDHMKHVFPCFVT